MHVELRLAPFTMHFLLVVCFRVAPLKELGLTSINQVGEKGSCAFRPFYRIVRRIRCYV